MGRIIHRGDRLEFTILREMKINGKSTGEKIEQKPAEKYSKSFAYRYEYQIR